MAGGPLPRIPSPNNQDIYAFKPTLALFLLGLWHISLL